MVEPCWLGVSTMDSNPKGRCCCNCNYQRPIVGHPWNEEFFVRTTCQTIIGYGCTCPELGDNIVFFQNQHGQCELHDFKRS